jgi:transposase InsO family protein
VTEQDDLDRGARPGVHQANRPSCARLADDLVNRKFHRLTPNGLWIKTSPQNRTRESRLYCCVVLDVFSRRIVGRSMDSKADATLVVNALDVAIAFAGPLPAASSTPVTEPVSTHKFSARRFDPPGWCRRFDIRDGLDNAMTELTFVNDTLIAVD